LKCETCGKIYKGTQGLERHLSLKKGFHIPSKEAVEILNRIRRKSAKTPIQKFQTWRPSKQKILPKPPTEISVATQTENFQNFQTIETMTPLNAMQESATQINPALWDDSRTSFACQTYFNDTFHVYNDPIPDRAEYEDMVCQTDSHFPFEYELESAGTQTDFIFEDNFDMILKDVFTETEPLSGP
jgi:hypothetical protein